MGGDAGRLPDRRGQRGRASWYRNRNDRDATSAAVDQARREATGDPVYSTDGFRSDRGFRFENPDEILATAEQFIAEVDTEGALTVESSRHASLPKR